MEEIVNVVVKRTGLPKETARQAVDAVLDYLEERLPDPWGKQLRGVAENPASAKMANDLLDNLGNLLGGKK